MNNEQAKIWIEKQLKTLEKTVARIDNQDWSEGYILPNIQVRVKEEQAALLLFKSLVA